ncbi:MAG: hypothetical protein ACFFCS_28430 [Candidatus Hodarchaeota archaeon]
MNSWNKIRTLLGCFLLTSGFLTWYAISGGIITWTSLPLYGTPSTFILILAEIAAVITILLSGLFAHGVKNQIISIACDGFFIFSYYLLLVNPDLFFIISIENNEAPFSIPILLFGIGLCCELRNMMVLFFNQFDIINAKESTDDGLLEDAIYNAQEPSEIAGLVVAGILWGLSVQYLDYYGALWIRNAWAFIIPGFFFVIVILEAINQKRGNETPIQGADGFKCRNKGSKIAGWRFFLVFGFGFSIILMKYALQYAFFVSFPTVLGYDMSVVLLVLINILAITTIIFSMFNLKIFSKINESKELILDLVLLVSIGLAPYFISGIILDSTPELLGNNILSSFIFAFPVYSVYMIWKITKGFFLSMKIHKILKKKDEKLTISRGTAAFIIPLFLSIFLVFASFTIDYNFSDFEYYYGVLFFVFPSIGIFSETILRMKYKKILSTR